MTFLLANEQKCRVSQELLIWETASGWPRAIPALRAGIGSVLTLLEPSASGVTLAGAPEGQIWQCPPTVNTARFGCFVSKTASWRLPARLSGGLEGHPGRTPGPPRGGYAPPVPPPGWVYTPPVPPPGAPRTPWVRGTPSPHPLGGLLAPLASPFRRPRGPPGRADTLPGPSGLTPCRRDQE